MNKNIRKYNINILLFLFPFLIIIGKIIRWTLMKTVLVDNGIGYTFLNYISSGNVKFSILSDEFVMDTSGNASFIFYYLGKIFGISNTYISYEILITILWNAIVLYLIIKNKKSYSMRELLFLILSVIVLNIFDFCLAKEPIQFLYFLLIYFVLKSTKLSMKGKYIMSILILLLSVLTFRTYYLLIIVFFIVCHVLCSIFINSKSGNKILKIFCLLLLISFVYFMMLNVAKIIAPSSYSQLLRVRLRVSSASSDMRSLFMSNNLVIFSIDYLLMIIRMLFPLELIRLGPKYLFYIIYQLVITKFVFDKIKTIKNNNAQVNLALYIFLGFLCASATFEPDFGSWVRHETVLFPLMLIFNLEQEEEN